jgi:hypothetical protein
LRISVWAVVGVFEGFVVVGGFEGFVVVFIGTPMGVYVFCGSPRPFGVPLDALVVGS